LTKACKCEAEEWHKVTYVRPKNEELFCAHSIALYWKAWEEDSRDKIALIPFPPPKEKLKKLYKSLKKNVFIEAEKDGKIIKKPLNKAQIEILLNRAIILNYSDLF